MAYLECGNGHIFDTDQHQSCPYCSGNSNRIDFGMGDTIGRTVPAGVSAVIEPESNIGATVAPSNYKAERVELGKTVGVFKKSMKIEPVVGWLVCIEGADKGKDYRILSRNNSIGRGENMDICIKNDVSISRENHAKIGFDSKHDDFYLIPGDSVNNIYIGEQPIFTPTKLCNYQIIEIGESKLLFVALVNEFFNWNDGLR